MRECPKCRKANLTTRKFCIRCGASLLKSIKARPVKSESSPKPEPTPVTPRPTRAEQPSPTTEDRWVRPSEVAKDRVRRRQHSSTESEFEKAKRAFARAEEVGIDEEGSGIIETRMLRASEVKELLEGPEAMVIASTDESALMTPEADAAIQAPTTEEIEEQILGQWSTLVDNATETEIIEPLRETPHSTPHETTGFSSARYSDSSAESIETETTSESVTSPEIEPPQPTEPIPKRALEHEPHAAALSADQVITCPQCKSVITMDDYEYPVEIYSAMAAARLKQAKYLIVQGKEYDAQKIIKIARVLFEKADDGDGLSQLEQLEASIGISS